MIADFDIFYKAAQAMLLGLSPYTVTGFYNPAWALLPFLPLAVLPFAFAQTLYAIITCAGVVAALHRFGLPSRTILIVSLISPLLWLNVAYANVDWVVLLGATLPPPIGIWFVLIKPQIGIGVVLYWLLMHDSRRWRVFVPVTVALLLNYALLGSPAFQLGGAQSNVFPFGLPIAALLLWQAIKRSSLNHAAPIGLFLSPYLSITSWLMLSPLATSRRWSIVVCAGSWLVFVVWRNTL
jgi:hypothetical protein